jgi:hypothetical protein
MEAGLTRLTQYAGPPLGQTFPGVVWDAYTSHPNKSGVEEVNEQAMLDLRLRVPRTPYLVPFPGGMHVYGELGSEDRWASPRPNRGAYVIGIYVPQLFEGDTTDLRIEYADTDIARRRSGSAGYWYNSATYTSGMRHYGLPLGHWMGSDATDLYLRTTRHLTHNVKWGIAFDRSVRERGQPFPETKHEAGLDLAWQASRQTQVKGGYGLQRLQNPRQPSSVGPALTESAVAGITIFNRLLWVGVSADF